MQSILFYLFIFPDSAPQYGLRLHIPHDDPTKKYPSMKTSTEDVLSGMMPTLATIPSALLE